MTVTRQLPHDRRIEQALRSRIVALASRMTGRSTSGGSPGRIPGGGQPLEATESRYAGSRYALDVWFDVDSPGPVDAVTHA